MRYYLLLAVALISQILGYGSEPFAPDEALRQGRYAELTAYYQARVMEQPTASDYHNLGVALGLQNETAQSILAYERALHLDPYRSETRHNLRLAYERTLDGQSDGRPPALLDDLAYGLSMTAFQTWAIVLFALTLILLIIFRLGATVRVRRGAFYTSLATAVLWLMALSLILHQWYYQQMGDRRAIVLEQTSVYATPDLSGEPLLQLGAGASVLVVASEETTIQHVALAGGREVYLPSSAIEPVLPLP